MSASDLTSAPDKFSIHQDKPLTTGVALGCWCPTMDLLAVVMDDGQLSVHRLDWNRLWLAAPEVPVTALGWRPDGRVLATGHRDGSVCLYNVERCELLHHDHQHAAPVCDLAWVQAAPAAGGPPSSPVPLHHTGAYQNRHARLFARPLAPLPNHVPPEVGGGGLPGTPAPHGTWASPPSELSVLVSTDTSGHCLLSAFGQVHIASVQQEQQRQRQSGDSLDGAPGQPSARDSAIGTVSQVCLSQDLQHLVAVSAGLQGGPSASVTVYDTNQLQSHRRDIQQLALLSSQLTLMLNVAEQAIVQAHKDWDAAQSEVSRRLDQLRAVMEDHSMADPDLESELVCMLAAGHISPAMHSWLTSSLSEAGLRRLAKATDLAVQQPLPLPGPDGGASSPPSSSGTPSPVHLPVVRHRAPRISRGCCGTPHMALSRIERRGCQARAAFQVHALLLDHLQPAAEVIVFLLGELRGLALHLEGRPALGLQAAAFASAELEGVKVVLQGEALRLAVTRNGAQLRAFFLWLLKKLQLLELASSTQADSSEGEGATLAAQLIRNAPVDVLAVLDFLTGSLQHDAVGVDLSDGAYDRTAGIGSLTFDGSHLEECWTLMDIMYRDAAAPGAAAWPDRPLRKQLKHLAALCSSTCRALPAVISPTISPILQLPLAPGLLQIRTTSVQSPQMRVEASAQTDTAGGAMLHFVCAIVPPGLAGVDAASYHLLLIKISVLGPATGPDQGTGARARTRQQVHAILVTVPPGDVAEDVSFYRDTQLAVLLSPRSGGSGGHSSSTGSQEAFQEDAIMQDGSHSALAVDDGVQMVGSRLVIFPTSELDLADISPVAGGTLADSVVQACISHGAVAPMPITQRSRSSSAGTRFVQPLLVSAPRGVAALLTSSQRVIVLDLEEDEERTEDDDGGEGIEEGD